MMFGILRSWISTVQNCFICVKLYDYFSTRVGKQTQLEHRWPYSASQWGGYSNRWSPCVVQDTFAFIQVARTISGCGVSNPSSVHSDLNTWDSTTLKTTISAVRMNQFAASYKTPGCFLANMETSSSSKQQFLSIIGFKFHVTHQSGH